MLVHYEGRLTDGTIFDSSYDRKQSFEFPIGLGKVVKGWDIGIVSMNLAEKAELTIPCNELKGLSWEYHAMS